MNITVLGSCRHVCCSSIARSPTENAITVVKPCPPVGNSDRDHVSGLSAADDELIAPSASAICKMLSICDNYAIDGFSYVFQCPEVEMYGNTPEL